MKSKQEIRSALMKKRAQMEKEDIQALSALILEKVFASKQYQKAQKIFCYVSAKGEPDTVLLIQTALNDGKTVAVPSTQKDGHMEAVCISSMEDLTISRFGIKEPVFCEDRRLLPEDVDLIIVPGVALGRGMERIGFGGGYYDRYLQRAEKAYRLAVCYDFQLFDSLPCEAHDLRMDGIVTESEFLFGTDR